MKSILDRFSDWAERKKRLSQIKIIYQNQNAIAHLIEQLPNMEKFGFGPQGERIEGLKRFRGLVNDHIVKLTVDLCLSDECTNEQLKINTALKYLYADLQESRGLLAASMGHQAGVSIDFPDRFKPAAGWESFSDQEWDDMVAKALRT